MMTNRNRCWRWAFCRSALSLAVIGACILNLPAIVRASEGGAVKSEPVGKASDDEAARWAGARQLIAVVLEDVPLLPKAADRVSTYSLIAEAQAKMADIAGAGKSLKAALKAAAQITDEQRKSGAYCGIASTQMLAGDASGARESIVLAKKAAASVGDADQKAVAYFWVSSAQTKAGDLPGAEETAAQISAPEWIVRAYCDIFRAQATDGDRVAAGKSLETARKAAIQVAPPQQGYSWADIAEAQSGAADAAGAMATAAQINDVIGKASAYSGIATAQAKAGNLDGARETLAVAKAAAAKTGNESEKVLAYREIAEAQIAAGDLIGAGQSVDAAKFAITRIKEAVYRDLESNLIAGVAADTGNFADAIAIAATIEDSGTKALAYGGIAGRQAESGDIAGAEATAAQISEKRNIVLAYAAIVLAKAKAGRVTEAIEYSAQMIEDVSARCSYLTDAAKELCSPPEKPKAAGK